MDDFRLSLPQVDLRVVTGLKYQVIETTPEEQHKQFERSLEAVEGTNEHCKLIRYLLIHYDFLKNFKSILSAFLSLSNYLMDKFDCNVTWKEACGLSVGELFGSESMISEERSESIVATHGNDKKLKELFSNFADEWNAMVGLRDRYPVLLNFRFMCHGDAMSEQMATEITDPAKSKVAYLWVTESNVESLAINSVLQTLSKIQNDVLTAFTKQFSQVNGIKPVRVPL